MQAAKDAPVPQYELMLERYKFMQKLGSKGSSLPEEIVAQIKVCRDHNNSIIEPARVCDIVTL